MSSPLAKTPDNLEAQDHKSTAIPPPKRHTNWWLVLLYTIFMVVGFIGMPLLQRLYFTHGGNSKWLQSLLQSVGFFLIPLPLPFLYFKTVPAGKRVFLIDPKVMLSSACLGFLYGISSFLYSLGLSGIPASTCSLLISTNLAFNALFAFVIVRQKITFYSLDSVVVVTCGAVVLALHTSGDAPLGETRKKYFLAFFASLGGAALQGLMYPLIELAYSKSTVAIDSSKILQFQTIMGLFASVFNVAGILISKDYKIIAKEAREFGLGETKYYIVLVASMVVSQFAAIGVTGVISCTTSLFAGILSAAMLPLIEVAAIISFGERFNGPKGLSLVLCLWGFASYFFGEHKKSGKTGPVIELSNVDEAEDSSNETHPKANVSE